MKRAELKAMREADEKAQKEAKAAADASRYLEPMSDVIDAAKNGNVALLTQLLDAGGNIEAKGEVRAACPVPVRACGGPSRPGGGVVSAV